jgi:hypothetical protein
MLAWSCKGQLVYLKQLQHPLKVEDDLDPQAEAHLQDNLQAEAHLPDHQEEVADHLLEDH